MNPARALSAISCLPLCAALAAGPSSASAQSSAPGDAPAGASAPAAAMTPAQRHDWERSHRASKIIGSEVRTRAGEKVGEIRDLVLDDQGRIVLAIVSSGGLLGVGDRLHAVPWDLLAAGERDDRILGIDKARLDAAPGFSSRTWPNLNDERWQADNRRRYEP
jgi:sporulation protein YlmC with PRC-barrel domain